MVIASNFYNEITQKWKMKNKNTSTSNKLNEFVDVTNMGGSVYQQFYLVKSMVEQS